MKRIMFVVLVACSACGPQPAVGDSGAGGGAATGGGSATGGGAATGGGSATGGGAATGGGDATGGGSMTGGGSATGGGSTTGGGTATGGGTGDTDAGATYSVKKVFVIAMENQGTTAVYDANNAPYLNNTLMVEGAYATAYGDVLGASVVSEPHYVWLEAGTNVFGDHTFSNDNDVSASNSTSSTAHLVTQMAALPSPKTWRAYQEGINTTTGACPVASSGYYAPKHDPFVFFQDVSGNPPSKTNTDCAAHHRPFLLADFQNDLLNDDVAEYTFITPNLCNDMHGALTCSNGCLGSFTIGTCVSTGDAWLHDVVPVIRSYLDAHDGVLMIVWDEPESTGTQPFVIIGPHVKAGHPSSVALSHSSYLKSLQRIFGVDVFSDVSSANDFGDFFDGGVFY